MDFSVSMCVYHKDDPKWFRQAADSVLNQTEKPSEVVLVVDGPVPEALDRVISGYEAHSFFKVIRLSENQGHGIARRTGLDHCSHELVALMDADDISRPDRFEKQLKLFREDKSLSVIGGNIAEFVGERENTVGIRAVCTNDAQIREDMKTRCPLNQMTVMFRKADVMKAGGYLDWYCNEDYYLWLRMYMAGMRFANVPEVLVDVRVGENMYQRRGGWKYFSSEWKLQNYMLKNRVIDVSTYAVNVAKRLVVQVLLPNRLRGWVFNKFARVQTSTEETV